MTRAPSDVTKSDLTGLPLPAGEPDRAPPPILSQRSAPGAEARRNLAIAAEIQALVDALALHPGEPPAELQGEVIRTVYALWQVPLSQNEDEVFRQACQRGEADAKPRGELVADPWPLLRRALHVVAIALPTRTADATAAYNYWRSLKIAGVICAVLVKVLAAERAAAA